MLPKGSASDAMILKRVNQRLVRGSQGSNSRISAVVSNHKVTLSGNIRFENQRRLILKAASGVDGVSQVVDQLQVQSRDAHRR